MTERQRSIRWWIAFVAFSAAIGPLLLRPPLWGEYRREQLLGFAIGMLAWSFAAALLLRHGGLS